MRKHSIIAAACCVASIPISNVNNLHSFTKDCDQSFEAESNEFFDKHFGLNQLSSMSVLERKVNDLKVKMDITPKQENTLNEFLNVIGFAINSIQNNNLEENLNLFVHDEISIRINLVNSLGINNIIIYDDGDIFYSFVSSQSKSYSQFVDNDKIEFHTIVLPLTYP